MESEKWMKAIEFSFTFGMLLPVILFPLYHFVPSVIFSLFYHLPFLPIFSSYPFAVSTLNSLQNRDEINGKERSSLSLSVSSRKSNPNIFSSSSRFLSLDSIPFLLLRSFFPWHNIKTSVCSSNSFFFQLFSPHFCFLSWYDSLSLTVSSSSFSFSASIPSSQWFKSLSHLSSHLREKFSFSFHVLSVWYPPKSIFYPFMDVCISLILFPL